MSRHVFEARDDKYHCRQDTRKLRAFRDEWAGFVARWSVRDASYHAAERYAKLYGGYIVAKKKAAKKKVAKKKTSKGK